MRSNSLLQAPFRSTPAFKEECDASHDAVYFKVVDTGCGIDKDKLDRLFESFLKSIRLALAPSVEPAARHFQTSGRTDGWPHLVNQSAGCRIHLSLRASLATYRSESCFPLLRARTRWRGDQIESDFAARQAEDFVCDDNADNRNVICGLLAGLGYQSDSVCSADEVVDRLKNESYDVVLLDIRMPGRDGYELTSAIREVGIDGLNRDQYIIAVTAYAMQEDRDVSRGRDE